MKAFHGDPKLKQKYLDRVKHHMAADNLIRGKGWIGGKGCAVGCTLEAYDHVRYETELGIPEWLARVEDTLFEGMSLEKSKTWPLEFLKAIPVGVDADRARVPFIIKILERNLRSLDACVFDREKNPDAVKVLDGSRAAVVRMIEAQKSGDKDKISSAAWSAARAARSAELAAWSAESAAAWSAESAARSAELAAWSALAWSVAETAEFAARSARSARSAEWSAAYDEMADELLEILRGMT